MNTIKYVLIILFLPFFFSGCTGEDEINIEKELVITVNNEIVRLISQNVSANGNCNSIFVSSSYTASDSNKFRIEFQLTETGGITRILFVDYSDNNRHYASARFISSKVFKIDNFVFGNGPLSFDFIGTLYEVGGRAEATKTISGSVEVGELFFTPCTAEQWEIGGEINGELFNGVEFYGYGTTRVTNWRGISDDGFMITIFTEEGLENLPIGAYPFTKDSVYNRVILEKYNGPASALFSDELLEYWDRYDYEGELIIDSQDSQTVGRFRLKATRDGKVVYEIPNGHFTI